MTDLSTYCTLTAQSSKATVYTGEVFTVVVNLTGVAAITAPVNTQIGTNNQYDFDIVSADPYPSGSVVANTCVLDGAPGVGQVFAATFTMRPKQYSGLRNVNVFVSIPLQSGQTLSGSIAVPITVLSTNVAQAPPDPPFALTATAHATLQSIALAWTNPTSANPATSNEIWRSTASGSDFAKVATVGANAVAYTDTGLTASTTYYYKVCASNGNGPSAFTSVANATTPLAPPAPAAPAALAATANTPHQVALSWTCAATTEDGFRVYRGTTSGAYVLLGTLPANAIAFTDDGVAADSTYYYVVKSFNASGESAASNEASVTTPQDNATFTPVSGFTLTPGAQVSCKQVAGRLLVCSDLDRMVEYCNRKWFQAGLKPHRDAPTVAAYGAVDAYKEALGGIEDLAEDGVTKVATSGKYKAYVTVFSSDRVTRSIPSPASAEITLKGQCITITPKGNEAFTVVAATNATPIRITTDAAHGLSTGASVNITGATGNTAANGVWRITYVSTTEFTLDTSIGNGAYTANSAKCSTKVACRDIAYDENGSVIDGADYWEGYVQESSMLYPMRVCLMPLDVLSYTTETTLGLADLNDGTHRPMELLYQSSIPAACGHLEFFENRVNMFGERTIKTGMADIVAGAALTVTHGAHTFTVANYVLTDAIYQKELFINGRGTGWFVTDVISDTQAEIKHSDQAIEAAGFNGTTGTYSNFAFAGKKSRVYRSGFFSGEMQGGITFTPETMPPLNVMEPEYDPDDNQDPTAAITARDAMFVFKKGKAFYAKGGTGTDESGSGFPQVIPISRNSGLLAPKSICRDSFDTIYGLSDKGLVAFDQSGIQEIGTSSGNQWMFRRFFDIADCKDALGAFFPRDNCLVMCGLSRIGAVAKRRDGFVYLLNTKDFCPFTLSAEVTCLLACQMDTGEFQLLAGDSVGRVMVLFQTGLYTDEVDYTKASPYTGETPYTMYIKSGVVPATHALNFRLARPHHKQTPLTTGLACSIAIDGKLRSADASTFTADVTKTYTSGVYNPHLSLGGKRVQTAVVKWSATSSRLERIEINGLELEADVCGSS